MSLPETPARNESRVRSDFGAKTALLSLATLLSRLLGLVRDQFFALMLGASLQADAYNIAFRIPNLLRDLFAEGALSAAFIPAYSRADHESADRGFDLLITALIAFQKWEEWVNAALAAWLIVSPFILAFGTQTTVTWNQVAVGVLVGMLAIWAAMTTEADDLSSKA